MFAESPTIQAPSGWKLVGIEVNGTIATLATYARVAGSSEPASYTWKFSAAQAASGAIVALRGSGSSLSEAAGRVNAKASDIVSPATDVNANRSLVLGFFAAARSTSISAPPGMTELGEAASTAGTYKVSLEVSGWFGHRWTDRPARRASIGQLGKCRPAGRLRAVTPLPLACAPTGLARGRRVRWCTDAPSGRLRLAEPGFGMVLFGLPAGHRRVHRSHRARPQR